MSLKLAALAAVLASLALAAVPSASAEPWFTAGYPNYAWGMDAAPVGDRIVVAGGLGFPNRTYGLLRKTFSMSPGRTWSDAAVPDLPAGRADAAVAASGGKVYVAGGLGLVNGRRLPVAGVLSYTP